MWKRLTPPLLAALSLVAATIAIIDTPLIDLSIVDRVNIGTLAVVITAVWLGMNSIDKPKILNPPPLKQPPEEQITQAREDVSNRYTKQQIDHFFTMLTDLPAHLVRVIEEVELEERSIWVTTKLAYQYSSRGGLKRSQEEKLQTLLVPLVTPEKGTLLDFLRVTDSSGDEVATLSQYDMRGLLAIILETLFLLAIKEGPDPGGAKRQNESLTSEERCTLKRLIGLACRIGRLVDKDYCTAFRQLSELPSISDPWKRRLEDFCRLYATHYAIVAEVTRPSSNQVSLAYGQRLHTENLPTKQHDRLRRRFGLSPNTIELPLALYAFIADSYHLQLNGLTHTFTFDARVSPVGWPS